MMTLVWLASYPKSGNTWLRALLNNYVHNGDVPHDINDLSLGMIASAFGPLDTALGVASANLTPDEAARYRPHMWRMFAEDLSERRFIKVHDAFDLLPDGEPLFPADATEVVVYILRNPLDVVASAQHFFKYTLEETVDVLNEPTYTLAANANVPVRQLRQRLGIWGEHVLGWVDDAPRHGFRVHVLRYEDLVQDPHGAFAAVLRAYGETPDDARLARAVAFSAFEELQAQERAKGFNERMHIDRHFFRKGKAGAWREDVPPALAARVIAEHGAVMRRFGYLQDDGTVVDLPPPLHSTSAASTPAMPSTPYPLTEPPA